jgi:hypothetical protein
MSLFVVEHQHTAEQCPAHDAEMALMLLKHLSPENAAGYDVTIRGEAVIDNAHRLYLILDAPDREQVERFVQPFAQAGSIEIMAASSCESVVDRGTCEAL